MIDMAERILTRAVKSSTYGVNVQIAAAASYGWLNGSDAAPPQFAAGAIGDETDTNAVAWGDFPPGDPALSLSQVAEWQMQGEVMTVTGRRDSVSVPLLFRYQHNNPDTAQASRDWFYTMRALCKTLRTLMKDSNATDQQLGGVTVYACENFRPVGPFQTRADQRITGGLIVTVDVGDNAP